MTTRRVLTATASIRNGVLRLILLIAFPNYYLRPVYCRQLEFMNVTELQKMAHCEAKCIQQECKAYTDTNVNNATGCVKDCKNTTDCEIICECLYTYDIQTSSKMLTVLPPTIVCQDLQVNSKIHSEEKTVLVSFVIQLELANEEQTAFKRKSIPVIYVVEMRNSTMYDSAESLNLTGIWEPIAKTQANLLHVFNLYPSWQYQFRVTALAPDGILGSNQSDWLQTISANTSLPPPKKLYVKNAFPSGRNLSAILKWEPPDEKLCYYNLYYYYNEGSIIRGGRIFLPEVGLQLQLNQLAFNANYTIQMETVSSYQEAYSSKVLNWTKTQSCLEAFEHNFTLCGPGPPENVHTQVYTEESGNQSVRITWLPPKYTTKTNLVLRYRVTIKSMFHLGNLLNPPYYQQFYADGNMTEAKFRNIPRGQNYSLEVRGISIGGQGRVAMTHFFVPNAYASTAIDDGSYQTTVLLFIGIPCFLFVIMIVTGIAAFKISCHRFMKTTQNRYFNSVEETKLQGDAEMDDTQPNCDVFEVDFNSLLLREVLGQGAFGIVRKAQMKINKPWEVWENVAVKMMRPGYHDCDENQLLEEIEMIKNVGRHPNIVSVLAYCTKPPNICLVVEYCEFGDLQSYLRKMRDEKFQTMVYKSKHSSEQTNISVSDSGTEYPSIITYKTIKHSPCNSENETIQKLLTQMMPTEGGFDKEDSVKETKSSSSNSAERTNDHYAATHLIANDLLSFARQIAMGMEYLSNNKYVHRDLAARNVLVHTPRIVKISDFGLMRDIYENSFYRRKTEAKLPIKWMAYESIFDHLFTTKSDVWAFGILLWEIVTLGGTPYPGISNMQLISLLKQGYRMERPKNCSNELYEVMVHCWCTNANQRPTFTELRHKFEAMLESTLEYVSLNIDPDVNYQQTDDSP